MKLFVLLVKQTHKNIQSTTEKKTEFFSSKLDFTSVPISMTV